MVDKRLLKVGTPVRWGKIDDRFPSHHGYITLVDKKKNLIHTVWRLYHQDMPPMTQDPQIDTLDGDNFIRMIWPKYPYGVKKEKRIKSWSL
jgi:hypothetical protein